MNTGSGDDVLHIVGNGIEYGGTAVEESGIFLGQGNDKLLIDGDVLESVIYTDRESAVGNEHSGNDSVTINGQVSGTSIHTGGGDDTIVINGGVWGEVEYQEGGDDGYIRSNLNVIDAGSGNDSLTVNGGVESMDINMGEGNDHVSIDLSLGGVWSSSIDGGSGTDVLTFTSSQYGQNWSQIFSSEDSWSMLGEYSGNTFSNFEILHLDLSNGDQEEINLDFLVEQVKGMQSEGRFNSIVVTGDEGDRALLDSLNWGEGQAVSVAPGGIEGNFMHYSQMVDDQEMHLYIAIQQQVINSGV